MYFVYKNYVIEKTRLAAYFSFFAGLVSFMGLFSYLTAFFNVVTFLEQMSKITCHSNLLAFFVSTMYLWKPNHKIFDTNAFAVCAVILLWFAGLGFWCILFPVYFIDLGSLVIPSQIRWSHFSAFYAIWNHSVTQIFFLIFFFFLIRKSNPRYLVPVNTRSLLFVIYCYLCVWVVWNVVISVWEDVFPTYGIFTNFNPYTKFTTMNKSTSLFSLRTLLASHFACFVLSLSLIIIFSTMSIKFRAMNHYKHSEEILKNITKPIKGFI